MKEQEIISAQQELKHLRTRCGKVFQFLLSRELNLFLIVFLVTHMVPFFSVRSLRTFFSIERYEKSPSRRARELLCIFRRYDSITLLQRMHPRF